jgi:hypothetical protein
MKSYLALEADPLNSSSENDLTVALLPEAGVTNYQTTSPVIAQQFDQDIVADLGNAVNTFIESGQVWALLIGFVLGYLLRSVTTYK